MKNLINQINWDKVNGLVPAIIQKEHSGEVLMLGFMNEEALITTIETKQVHFFSRTKQQLWCKGETSGNYLNLINIKLDCDQDTLLVTVEPIGPTCHTGTLSCFGNNKNSLAILTDLLAVIKERKREMPTGSYTSSLFAGGLDKICLKVAEESLEVIQAATKETKQRLIEESCDLIYHFLVLLVTKDVDLNEITAELEKRHKEQSRVV